MELQEAIEHLRKIAEIIPSYCRSEAFEVVIKAAEPDNRIKQIADANGMEVILNKLTEECGELVTAIAKYRSGEYETLTEQMSMFDDIVMESADVHILTEQLNVSCNSQKCFDLHREQKIERQLKRMEAKANVK